MTRWSSPPKFMLVGGSLDFLRDRTAARIRYEATCAGLKAVDASAATDIPDLLNPGGLWDEPHVVFYRDAKPPEEQLVSYISEVPAGSTFVAVVLAELKKDSLLVEASTASTRFLYNEPSAKKDLNALAKKFVIGEAEALVGKKDAISAPLAEALVKALGTDIGLLAQEIKKYAAAVRARGGDAILPKDVNALGRSSTEIQMDPLRAALAARDGVGLAKALRKFGPDHAMLLLRGKGGPADLAVLWLRAGILFRQGASPEDIGGRLGVPAWAVERDLMPAVKRWDLDSLKKLIRALGRADSGVLKGDPNAWALLECALLMGCC